MPSTVFSEALAFFDALVRSPPIYAAVAWWSREFADLDKSFIREKTRRADADRLAAWVASPLRIDRSARYESVSATKIWLEHLSK